jgi:hypothetical protein
MLVLSTPIRVLALYGPRQRLTLPADGKAVRSGRFSTLESDGISLERPQQFVEIDAGSAAIQYNRMYFRACHR